MKFVSSVTEELILFGDQSSNIMLRGGRRLVTSCLVHKARPRARKQAHANLFTFPLRRWVLHLPPSVPFPHLELPLPFLRRLNHSTLNEDEANQEKVDPVSLVAEELACLASNLRMCVTADILNVPSLASAAEYFFKIGVEGKRFRPMVLMLMASSLNLLPSPKPELKLGVDDRRIRQYRVAEITELIHVATLVHDDVVDQSESRRGISSLNHNIGNKLAVLAGDFLLAKASIGLSTLKNGEVMALVSETLEHMATGEFMQLTANAQQSCSMEYYLQKTYLKTASLMANSCKSIALLADQPREVAMHAFDYGRHLGIAYQLVDDALDFTGTSATLGKPALADLRESLTVGHTTLGIYENVQGITTAPILFALQDEPFMQTLINRKFGEEGDSRMAVKLVNRTRGVAKTLDLADKHAQLAESAIAQFPPCSDSRSQQCRKALADLTHSVVKRSI